MALTQLAYGLGRSSINSLANSFMSTTGRRLAMGPTGPQVLARVARAGWRVSPARQIYNWGRGVSSATGRMRTGGISPWSVRSRVGSPINSVDISSINLAPINDLGTNFLMNGTVPGDLINNRFGRTITMKSFHIQGEWSPGTTGNQVSMKLALVYDAQSNGVAPAWGDIYQLASGSPGSTTQALHLPRNLSNIDRFKVLWSNMYYLNGTNTNAVMTPNRLIFDKYVKIPNLVTKYNAGTSGNIADIQTGSLYLMCLSDSLNTASATNPLLTCVCRTNFLPNH